MPSQLPPHILEMVEFNPVEKIIVPVLRNRLPGINVYSLVPLKAPKYFVLVRRDSSVGDWDGDPRFLDVSRVRIDCFAVDPESDSDAARLSEAVRVALRDAANDQDGVPGLGHISRVRMTNEASKKTDWQTATGPVQYADLPLGTNRYESKYRVAIRRPT